MRVLTTILLIISISLSASKCNKKTYIPSNAKKYMPMLHNSILNIFKSNVNTIYFYYFPALIEHESCVRLCGNSFWARRCWNPKSRLKTKREEGAGLLQITRVFRKDGAVKWDTLRNLKRRYPKQLNELTWKNIYNRPDLQIRAGLLLWKSNMRYVTSIPWNEKLWFLDSIYNGGYKYLSYERKRCKLTKGCDPDKWFNNVEKMKSKRARRRLYGNRTAWDINRYHVRDVKIRMNKYKRYLDMF